MTRALEARARAALDVPLDVVAHIYSWCSDDSSYALDASDRLRALAVCKSWHERLSNLPLASLKLGRAPAGKYAWVAAAQPAVQRLAIEHPSPAEEEALRSTLCTLQPEALESLSWRSCYLRLLPEALPQPAAFPNLRALSIHPWAWDAAWLGRLAELPRLQHLELGIYPRGGRGAQLTLPPLPTLTALRVSLGLDFDDSLEGAGATLVLSMHSMPALEELSVDGFGTAELLPLGPDPDANAAAAEAGGLPPPGAPLPGSSRLRRLSLALERAAVDFRALPALSALRLQVGKLRGAATLSAAAQLESLELGGDPEEDARPHYTDKLWVAQLLRAAPPGLRRLRLAGAWVPDAAVALSALGQLRTLAVYDTEQCGPARGVPAARLGPGALWRGLRALRWHCRSPLPEAARHAASLELLDLYAASSTQLEASLAVLASAPAMQRFTLCLLEQQRQQQPAGGGRDQPAQPQAAAALTKRGRAKLAALQQQCAVVRCGRSDAAFTAAALELSR